MIEALVSGKLIRDPQIKISSNGNQYIQFLLSVSAHGEAETQIVSGIGFDQSVVDKVSLLKKGDSLSVVGSLKQTEWTDRVSNEVKHGLSITANQSLSIYDIKKRRAATPKADTAGNPASGNNPNSYNDEIDF